MEESKDRKQLEQTFCWKITGELKLFKYQMMQKDKETIYNEAYRIDCGVSIYELLMDMSGRISRETLEAVAACPGVLTYLYDVWMGYEDSHITDIQYCLDKELAKLRMEYKNRKEMDV